MTYQEYCDRISGLMDEHLGVRGKTLEKKMVKAGRLLPKSFHRDGEILIAALNYETSPKLARMIDDGEVQRAFQACEKYLSEVDPWDRRKNKMVGVLSTNAYNLIVISALVVGVMIWRGLI